MSCYLYFDGACMHNGKQYAKASYGWLIKLEEETLFMKGSGILPPEVKHTNNTAEYTALEEGLKNVIHSNLLSEEVICRGDSQLVINTFKKNWRYGRTPHLAIIVERIKLLLSKIPKWKMEWIPREQNEEADKLSTSVFPEKAFRKYDEAIRNSRKRKKEKRKMKKSKDKKEQKTKMVRSLPFFEIITHSTQEFNS